MRRLVGLIAVLVLVITGCGDDALTADDFIGIWHSNDGVFVDFQADGSLTAAWTLDELPEGTVEIGEWAYADDVFVWTVFQEHTDDCDGETAEYTVTRVEGGGVKWDPITDDACWDRAADLARGPMVPYTP